MTRPAPPVLPGPPGKPVYKTSFENPPPPPPLPEAPKVSVLPVFGIARSIGHVVTEVNPAELAVIVIPVRPI